MSGAGVRVGIVGVGGVGIAEYHTKAFLADARTALVACCDVQQDALTAYADRYSVKGRYTDFERMLAEAALDVVVICTNEMLHSRMTVQAAAHRPKAILCEKPMAMNLAEADAMLDACARNNVLLVIGHQRRYRDQYARAKEILQEGVVGDLEQIQVTAHPGCSLLPDGTHCVDLTRFFVDDAPVEWLIGQVDITTKRKLRYGYLAEDGALALYKFSSGVRVFLALGSRTTAQQETLGVPTFSGRQYMKITLRGTRGRIEIGGDRPVEDQPLLRIVRGDKVDVIEVDHEGWHDGLSPQSELLTAIEDRHRHPLEGKSARADLEILMAIYESARLRRLINLPLENRENPFQQILAEMK